MFFVICQKSYKGTNNGTTADKFAARTTTHVVCTISGPFARLSVAERVAASTMGTFGTLSAQVYPDDVLRALCGDREQCTQWGYNGEKVIRQAMKALELRETSNQQPLLKELEPC